MIKNNSNSVGCTPEPPDYSLFTPEEKQRFGMLVHDLRKQGFSLNAAQELAYSRVLCDDIRKQMGLEADKEFVIHCATRHTFSSTLLNKDISLATIRDLLGQSSIRITERVYAHLDPRKLIHAINVLE
jgi:integrase